MALASEIMQGGLSAQTALAIQGSGASVAATGSAQADGAVPKSSVIIVTGADGTKAITLPAVSAGQSITAFNNSASTLVVFPPAGAAICVPGTGLGSANSSFAHLTYKTAVYTCQSATQWLVNVTV